MRVRERGGVERGEGGEDGRRGEGRRRGETWQQQGEGQMPDTMKSMVMKINTS